MRAACLTLLLCTLLGAGLFTAPAGAAPADVVFVLDATSGMGDELTEVGLRFSQLTAAFTTHAVDARYAIVLLGGEPELVLDFTADPSAAQSALNTVSAAGAVAGFQHDHSVETLEAGLEAMRLVLGTAAAGVLIHDHVGGTGVLSFRPGARKVVLLVTDEDSDWPYFAGNRLAGQITQEPPTFILGTGWQLEVDGTAQDLISHEAFFFAAVNAGDLPTRAQYGDPFSLVSNPDFTGIDFTATYQNLVAGGYGNSLQAQMLAAGLIALTFDVTALTTPMVMEMVYAAVALELSEQPVAVEPTTWGRLKRTYP